MLRRLGVSPAEGRLLHHTPASDFCVDGSGCWGVRAGTGEAGEGLQGRSGIAELSTRLGEVGGLSFTFSFHSKSFQYETHLTVRSLSQISQQTCAPPQPRSFNSSLRAGWEGSSRHAAAGRAPGLGDVHLLQISNSHRGDPGYQPCHRPWVMVGRHPTSALRTCASRKEL